MGLAPGTELGGYRVLAPLGQGGMGAVYRAVDADGVGVALKLVHAHLADGSARDRLAREVSALQKVRHPGVARVLDAELDSAEAFVVTELVDGSDLAASVTIDGALGTGRLDELADLAEKLAAALEAVHTAGVLHRDLTPGNVMMTSVGPVLIDFGIAQVVEDARLTTAGQVAGTPGYLSPELLAGAEPGRTDDWWGWAAVLAFAATGRPPFGVRPLSAVLARVRSGEPDLAGIDPRVARVLAATLAVDRDGRTPHQDVVEALHGIADGDEAWDVDAVEQTEPDPTLVLGPGGTRVLAAPGDPSVPGIPRQAGVDGPPPPPRAGTPPAPPSGVTAETQVVAPGDLGPDDWDEDWAAEDQVRDEPAGPEQWAGAPVDPLGRPTETDSEPRDPPLRRGTMLALGAVALAAGASWPGATLLVVLVVAVLVRSIGLDVDAHHARRARRGSRRSDGTRTVLAWPWYLVRALLGILPAALVAASALVLVGGVGWWLLGSGRLVLAGAGAGDAGGFGGNAPWVESALVAVAVLVALVTLWFGPAGTATRRGARWTAAAVAPGARGAVVVVLLALAVAAALGSAVLLDGSIDWWPSGGPPTL